MYNDKVGILTFHDVRNYGASLQAYALQKKLQEIFLDVEIINYHNAEIQKRLKLWNFQKTNIKTFLHTVFGAVFYINKKHAFDTFNRAVFRLSPKFSKEDLQRKTTAYNILVTGSDQVWCARLTNHDPSYFLDFAKENQIKIAYAPSFGDDPITDLSLTKYLNQFDLLTVREEIASEALKKNLAKDYTVVCDPTLLLEAEEWDSIASKRFCREPYVFLFMIHESKALMEQAERFSREKGLRLISNKSFPFFQHLSPMDFLSWVKYADYVFTNSFHGTVFSLIFQKQFVCHCFSNTGKKKLRLLQLLDMVKLSHRTIDNPDFKIEEHIPWEEIQAILSEYAEYSWGTVLHWFEKNRK